MNMEKYSFVRIKSKNKYGVLMIPSYFIDAFGHKTLNNVALEDDTIVMVPDYDLEVVNDRTTEVEE